jgi:hypothetical protein
MANACIPPASTIAGLLLEQTDRTETKFYYKHYAVTTMAQHISNAEAIQLYCISDK